MLCTTIVQRTAKAWSEESQSTRIGRRLFFQIDPFEVLLENLSPLDQSRQIDKDVPVESAGSQEGSVENFGSIRRG